VRMQVINSKVYQRRFNPHEVMKKMSKSWSLRRDVWKGILRRMQRMIMRLMMLTTLINKRFCHQSVRDPKLWLVKCGVMSFCSL